MNAKEFLYDKAADWGGNFVTGLAAAIDFSQDSGRDLATEVRNLLAEFRQREKYAGGFDRWVMEGAKGLAGAKLHTEPRRISQKKAAEIAAELPGLLQGSYPRQLDAHIKGLCDMADAEPLDLPIIEEKITAVRTLIRDNTLRTSSKRERR